MYLSRLILNPRSRRVQKELAAPYEMHRTLSRSFGTALDAGEERFLFRADQDRSGVCRLLVQSLTAPDWSWLADPGARDYLLAADGPNPATKAVDLLLRPGQTLSFRLRANPTRKLSSPGQGGTATKKRVGLYKEDEQVAWLRRKAEAGGFDLLSVRMGSDGMVTDTIHRRHDAGTHRAKLLAVTFDGFLRVRDPRALVSTVEAGIGSGKAFGFGLLSLAPAT